jgi:hypothetical protein
MALPASTLGPGGFIPADDGYMPGDSAFGNPVRQLGSVSRNPAMVRPGPGLAGNDIPILGVLVVAGLLYVLEHRRLGRLGKL